MAQEPGRRFSDEEQLRTAPRTDDGIPAAPLTDEEAGFLRHARFGRLPDRATPAEWTELTESTTRVDLSEPFDPLGGGETSRL